MIQGVIFDLYNTLLCRTKKKRPYAALARALNMDLREVIEVALTQPDHLKSIVDNSHTDILKQFEEVISEDVQAVTLYPEAKEIIEKLRERDIKIGIISNLSVPYQKPFFTLGLAELTDEHIFSCNVDCKKPDEKIYQLLVNRLMLAKENLIMVGDSLINDVTTPKNIGIQAIHLDRTQPSLLPERICCLTEILSIVG